MLAIFAGLLTACGGGSSSGDTTQQPPVTPQNTAPDGVYVLDASGRIHWFAGTSSSSAQHEIVLQGLAGGEFLVGIDGGSAPGQLIGLGSLGGVYDVDATTGMAVQISSSGQAVTSANVGFDFDAADNQILVSIDGDEQFEIDSISGLTQGLGLVDFIAGDINAGANLNLVALAAVDGTPGFMYGLDANQDALVRFSTTDPLEAQTVGSLGVDISEAATLDIEVGSTTEGWMLATVGGQEGLYRVDLTTGSVTLETVFAVQVNCRGMALGNLPELPAATVHAVTRANVLVSFKADDPSTMLSQVAISGMANGEAAIALDLRPATDQLVALTNQARAYVIDAADGSATLLSTQTVAGIGTTFGSSFELENDQLHLISDSGQNLSIDVASGTTSEDGALAYAAGDVNFGSTVLISALAPLVAGNGLFAIDADIDALVRIPAPSLGTLQTVGALGIDVSGEIALDMSASGELMLVVESGQQSALHLVDATTGTATFAGLVLAGDVVVDIAVERRAIRELEAFALTSANELVEFASTNPAETANPVAITGLIAGEAALAIAHRPATGMLIVVTDLGNVYEVDAQTGAAALVSVTGTAVTGTEVGLDVDPVQDTARIMTSTGLHLTVDLATSVVASLALPAYEIGDVNEAVLASVSGVAFNSSVAGASQSTLFGADAAADAFVRAAANDGSLQTLFSFGFDAQSVIDLDIEGGTEAAFLLARRAGESASTFFKVDLESMTVVEVGTISASIDVIGFALVR